MIKASLRNTVANTEELFKLVQLGLDNQLRFLSVTNLNDVTPFLSKELESHRVANENYFQFGNMRLITGVLLWVSYGAHSDADLRIPVLGYNFDAEKLHVALEKTHMQLREDQEYLDSYVAINAIKEAGGQVFLAISNMHPLPDLTKLDEIFVHHYKMLDGVEGVAPAFTADYEKFLKQYAHSMGIQIAGGDGYFPKLPTDQFAKTLVPKSPLTLWLWTL